MLAYKLFRIRKDGSIGSLFINKRARLTTNRWIRAQAHPTKGYALRPYWHCTATPTAPHLSMRDRAWFQVEIKNYTALERPAAQGGVWYLASAIKILGKIEENDDQH